MRERVKQLGGRLEIETSRSGTRVKATIPSRHFRIAASGAEAQVHFHSLD
jgi:signal transduction histidine kinase